jgi:hypothetical protein
VSAFHHTKNKGDLGVAKAHADLVAQGFIVLFPATEHAPFDLVAYADDVFQRIQVKYQAANSGAVTVHFRSLWSDRNGVHVVPVDKSAIDVVCVYCPDTEECYYIDPTAFGASVTLRVAPSRNGQAVGVLEASEFRQLSPEVTGGPDDGRFVAGISRSPSDRTQLSGGSGGGGRGR